MAFRFNRNATPEEMRSRADELERSVVMGKKPAARKRRPLNPRIVALIEECRPAYEAALAKSKLSPIIVGRAARE